MMYHGGWVSAKPNLVAKTSWSPTDFPGYQCMIHEWVSINGIFRLFEARQE